MAEKVGITTNDNEFDFFDNFDAWNQFDMCHGYNTMAWLARIVPSIEELKDNFEYGDDEQLLLDEHERLYEEGIDILVRLDPFKRYKKVINRSISYPDT